MIFSPKCTKLIIFIDIFVGSAKEQLEVGYGAI